MLYSILLYMKKLSNTVNHSSKLMLTYFFRAVFINLYIKTKYSNEMFHLGFYSLSNLFSYIKHIRSKSNISALTISGKNRYIKIKAPSFPPPILLSTPPPPPFYGIVSIFPEGHFIMTSPILRYFSRTPTPHAYSTPLPPFPPPLLLQLSTEE